MLEHFKSKTCCHKPDLGSDLVDLIYVDEMSDIGPDLVDLIYVDCWHVKFLLLWRATDIY